MPYAMDSPNLPANVKSMSSMMKQKWISIFNSAYAVCLKNGGKDCEGMAFRAANGKAKEFNPNHDEMGRFGSGDGGGGGGGGGTGGSGGTGGFGGRVSAMDSFSRANSMMSSLTKKADKQDVFRNYVKPKLASLKKSGVFNDAQAKDIESHFERKAGFGESAKDEMPAFMKNLSPEQMRAIHEFMSGMMDYMKKMISPSQKESRNFNKKRLYDFTAVEISESTFEDTTGKREFVVTLLREGPGNQYHNNYYQKQALESTRKHLIEKPKQYFNHAKDIDNPDRDLRDWASSVIETWIDTSEPKAKLKARVKVFDNWLWERAKAAPEQMAVSIEGKGSGRLEKIDGQDFNSIYEITSVNGVNWVDYPGNAGMGVEVLESNIIEEDKKMTLQEVLESLKGFSRDDLGKVAESNPELKEFFLFGSPEQDEMTKKEISSLSERLSNLEKEKVALANKVDAYEIKDKERAKADLVEKLLTGSKLKDDHKTLIFKEQLMKCDEDGMKKLIEDREKICVAAVADPSQPGAGAGTLTEEDKREAIGKNWFNIELGLKKTA